MQFKPEDHTFAICAYKESPYLKSCIESLTKQTVATNIIMTTSTDNAYIRGLAKQYNIPLFVNEGEGGIANDWNFAYKSSKTALVTLAHQDDVYGRHYAEVMLGKLNAARNPLIFFANYNEIRNGKIVEQSTMLKVKRMMLIFLRPKLFQGSRFMKRNAIRMGNPVACWSVAYVKKNLPETVFVSDFRSNLDWEEWEKLSREKGEFVYSHRALTCHRVHEDSETSNTINHGNIRGQEDYQMFLKFWPAFIAGIIMKFYLKAEKYNNADET